MATIKSYTSLEQSKVLAKILPLESADMWYHGHYSPWELERKYDNEPCPFHSMSPNWDKPCWSLAALYSILPNTKKETTTLSRGGWRIDPIEYLDNWWCEYEDDSHTKDFTVSADNPVDACVTMIIKLHELKLL